MILCRYPSTIYEINRNDNVDWIHLALKRAIEKAAVDVVMNGPFP
jgi:hypothetical protein